MLEFKADAIFSGELLKLLVSGRRFEFMKSFELRAAEHKAELDRMNYESEIRKTNLRKEDYQAEREKIINDLIKTVSSNIKDVNSEFVDLIRTLTNYQHAPTNSSSQIEKDRATVEILDRLTDIANKEIVNDKARIDLKVMVEKFKENFGNV